MGLMERLVTEGWSEARKGKTVFNFITDSCAGCLLQLHSMLSFPCVGNCYFLNSKSAIKYFQSYRIYNERILSKESTCMLKHSRTVKVREKEKKSSLNSSQIRYLVKY